MNQSTREAVDRLAQRRSSLLDGIGDYTGIEWCRVHTSLADQVVGLLFEDLTTERPGFPPLAIVATGGYGREELAPYSDVDLVIIPSDEAHPATDTAVRTLFHDLHWAFGERLRLEVGYAFLLINDAPGLDPKTRTSFLDSRLVAGSPGPYDAFMDLFWETIPVGEFLLSKIRERERAMGIESATALVVEPQVKEGAGGLRSFQCANWLRSAIGERPARPTKAYERILRVRNMLHFAAGRKQDVLSRARQAELAERCGRDLYEFMGEIVEAGSELHREYCSATEKLLEARYPLAAGVTALRGEARISGEAAAGEAAVGIAVATQLGLRVAQIPTAVSTRAGGPEALYAVGTGEATLRNLDRCGLLEVLIPELTRCRYLIPSDTTHAYTVFEHTMRVIRNLDSLGPGSFLGEIRGAIRDPNALYLAALLHDVGKHEDEREHPRVGTQAARSLCGRWDLSAETADTVCMLVENHLAMSVFIRMRDVLSPATAAEFAQIVQNQERLDLLTLLTWADTAAVHEGCWTPAQESFLRELYERTCRVLQGDAGEEPDPALYRRRIVRELRQEQIEAADLDAFLSMLPTHYLLSTPPDLVKLHMKFEQDARSGKPTVEVFEQAELGTTDVTVCCRDAPGLLSKVLGVFYALDLSVHGIRASTTNTNQPVALDTFTISFGARSVPHATCRQMSGALFKVLMGELDVHDLLVQRGKDPERPQQFYQFSYRQGDPGILEFRAPRGRGMAYRLSRIVARQGWNVISARVGQWAGRGAAAFYIVGPDGRPVPKDAVEGALGGQV
jgi:[protein-PII] uridylyltransferase